MSAAVALLGDTSSHGGAVTSASPSTKVEGIAVARVGDSFVCPIHGGQTITSGSPRWKAEGRPVARTGSSISCGATLIGSAAITTCE